VELPVVRRMQLALTHVARPNEFHLARPILEDVLCAVWKQDCFCAPSSILFLRGCLRSAAGTWSGSGCGKGGSGGLPLSAPWCSCCTVWSQRFSRPTSGGFTLPMAACLWSCRFCGVGRSTASPRHVGHGGCGTLPPWRCADHVHAPERLNGCSAGALLGSFLARIRE